VQQNTKLPPKRTNPNRRTWPARWQLEGAEQERDSMVEAGEDAEESPMEPVVTTEQTSTVIAEHTVAAEPHSQSMWSLPLNILRSHLGIIAITLSLDHILKLHVHLESFWMNEQQFTFRKLHVQSEISLDETVFRNL
jgi:hypothetical protein